MGESVSNETGGVLVRSSTRCINSNIPMYIESLTLLRSPSLDRALSSRDHPYVCQDRSRRERESLLTLVAGRRRDSVGGGGLRLDGSIQSPDGGSDRLFVDFAVGLVDSNTVADGEPSAIDQLDVGGLKQVRDERSSTVKCQLRPGKRRICCRKRDAITHIGVVSKAFSILLRSMLMSRLLPNQPITSISRGQRVLQNQQEEEITPPAWVTSDVRLGDFVNGLLAEIRTGRGYDWRSVILVADDLLRRRTNKDCTLTDHKVTRLVLPVALKSVAAEQTRRMADRHTVSLEMTLDGLSVVSLLPLAGLLVFQELHCQD